MWLNKIKIWCDILCICDNVNGLCVVRVFNINVIVIGLIFGYVYYFRFVFFFLKLS